MPTEASGKSSSAGTTQSSAQGARIWRKHSDGMDLFAVESSPVSEFHLTITPQPTESPAAMVRRLAEAINPLEATVVRLMAFGSVDASKPTLAALRQAFDTLDLPLTWVEGLEEIRLGADCLWTRMGEDQRNCWAGFHIIDLAEDQATVLEDLLQSIRTP